MSYNIQLDNTIWKPLEHKNTIFGMVMSLEMYANIYVSHAHWLFKSDTFSLGKEKKW